MSKPVVHLSTNAVVGMGLLITGLLGSVWALIGFVVLGWAIDIDHALYMIFKYPNTSVKEKIAIGQEDHKAMRPGFYIFHSPELNALLVVSSFVFPVLWFAVLSNALHLTLDSIEHYQFHKNFRWMKEWSFIYQFFIKEKPVASL